MSPWPLSGPLYSCRRLNQRAYYGIVQCLLKSSCRLFNIFVQASLYCYQCYCSGPIITMHFACTKSLNAWYVIVISRFGKMGSICFFSQWLISSSRKDFWWKKFWEKLRIIFLKKYPAVPDYFENSSENICAIFFRWVFEDYLLNSNFWRSYSQTKGFKVSSS